jgi:tight adherence protein C
MELLLAAMVSLAVGAFVAAFARKDQLVAGRVAVLRNPLEDVSESQPSIVLRALGTIGGQLPGDRQALELAIATSGLQGIPVNAFVGARVVTALLGIVVGLQFGSLRWIAAAALGVAGYRLPLAYLGLRRRARNEEIAAQVPEAAELLAICTEGGLNVPLALSRVAFRTQGLLGEELRRTLRETEFGISRRDALNQLAARSQVSELRSIVAVLNGAERFGTRISSSLTTFAIDLRRKQRRAAEEQARRAPVKLLFPLVFLILPAFILLTIVPLLLGTFRTLGF